MKLFPPVEVFLGTCVHFSFLSCQLACMVLSIVNCGTFMQKTHLSPALTLLNNGHKKCQWEVCIEGIKFRPHKWSLTSSVWVGKPSTSAGQGEPSRLLILTSYYCRLPLYLILWKIWLISKTVDNQQKVCKPSIYKICFALHLCFIRNL